MVERDVDLDTLRKRIGAIEAGVHKHEVEPDDERTTHRGGCSDARPFVTHLCDATIAPNRPVIAEQMVVTIEWEQRDALTAAIILFPAMRGNRGLPSLRHSSWPS